MKLRKNLIVALAAAAFVLLLAALYVQQSQRELSLMVQVRIAEQAQTLASISELTHQNRADELAESIIRNCSSESRTEYEDLLNRLSTLNAVELQELEQLFDACASFFAERKAIMVARLEREFEVYSEYIALLSTLKSPNIIIDDELENWRSLVELEKERSALMTEQVNVQSSIISALKTANINDDTVQALLVRAQQINQRVTTINSKIQTVRDSLQSV